MNLADVMQEVADTLDTIDGLRCFGYPPPGATPTPAAVVSYPSIEFDGSYQRGQDTYTMPMWIVVGQATDQRSRDLLGPFCDGSGTSSVKAVLEAHTYTTCDRVRVASAEPDIVLDNAGNNNLAMRFDLVIKGSGA